MLQYSAATQYCRNDEFLNASSDTALPAYAATGAAHLEPPAVHSPDRIAVAPAEANTMELLNDGLVGARTAAPNLNGNPAELLAVLSKSVVLANSKQIDGEAKLNTALAYTSLPSTAVEKSAVGGSQEPRQNSDEGQGGGPHSPTDSITQQLSESSGMPYSIPGLSTEQQIQVGALASHSTLVLAERATGLCTAVHVACGQPVTAQQEADQCSQGSDEMAGGKPSRSAAPPGTAAGSCKDGFPALIGMDMPEGPVTSAHLPAMLPAIYQAERLDKDASELDLQAMAAAGHQELAICDALRRPAPALDSVQTLEASQNPQQAPSQRPSNPESEPDAICLLLKRIRGSPRCKNRWESLSTAGKRFIGPRTMQTASLHKYVPHEQQSASFEAMDFEEPTGSPLLPRCLAAS